MMYASKASQTQFLTITFRYINILLVIYTWLNIPTNQILIFSLALIGGEWISKIVFYYIYKQHVQ